jgi:hypothetical protein
MIFIGTSYIDKTSIINFVIDSFSGYFISQNIYYTISQKLQFDDIFAENSRNRATGNSSRCLQGGE